jgi:hypothetical protein
MSEYKSNKSMSEKYKILAIVGVIIIVGAVAAFLLTNHKNEKTATTTTQKSTTTPTVTKAPELTIDNASTRMTSAGFTIDGKDTPYYQTVGAANGSKLTVNSGAATIELYAFSDAKTRDAAQTQLASSGTAFTSGNILVLIDSTDGAGSPVDSALITKIKDTLQ